MFNKTRTPIEELTELSSIECRGYFLFNSSFCLNPAHYSVGINTWQLGCSFSTGGDQFSIGNAIKRFNPNVKGLSHGTSPFEFCFGPLCPSGTFLQPFNPPSYGLNAAQSGAWVTRGNLDNQFKYLSKYYRDFVPSTENPWKLTTFMMGFNNVCLGCISTLQTYLLGPDQFESNIRYALERLRNEYDKMIVVLAAPFKFSRLENVIKSDEACVSIRERNKIGCPCLGYESLNGSAEMDRLSVEYNLRMSAIAADYAKLDYPTFSVIYDPGLSIADLETEPVESELSAVDCFHPNRVSHEYIAISMWNNLFRPLVQKQAFGPENRHSIACPKSHETFWL